MCAYHPLQSQGQIHCQLHFAIVQGQSFQAQPAGSQAPPPAKPQPGIGGCVTAALPQLAHERRGRPSNTEVGP